MREPVCLSCGDIITGLIWGAGVCYECHDSWEGPTVREHDEDEDGPNA